MKKYAADTGKVTGEEALEFLEEIGLQGFQICSEYHDTLPRDGKERVRSPEMALLLNGLWTEVPVNYITESMLPVYEGGAASVKRGRSCSGREDQILDCRKNSA